MNWRIHLTKQSIRDAQILSGQWPLLAVWPQIDRVEFYDLAYGAWHGCRQIEEPPPNKDYMGEEWRLFLAGLVDLKGRACLPVVSARQTMIYSIDNGRVNLFREPDNRLIFRQDDQLHALDIEPSRLAAVDLDRSLGLVAALDVEGRLCLYRQGILRGAFDMGLRIDPLRTCSVAISHGGRLILLTDGRQIVMANTSGAVIRRLEVHYEIRQIACSPAGDIIAASDNEDGLIRVYSGADLALSHQRFAQDLIAEAQQIQLMADLPPVSAAVNALVAGHRGAVGFAMSGVICVTNVNQMARLPRVSSLF